MVIAIRMERISRDADKLRSILASAVVLLLSTEKQDEQRSEPFVLACKNNENIV